MPEKTTDPKAPAGSPSAEVNRNAKPDQAKDVGRVMVFFYYAISISLLLTSIGAWKGGLSAGITAVLWATGGLAVGTFAGFLFGIPKILQRGQGAAESMPAKSPNGTNAEQSYRQQVNTNLTEISDWLTKIIVGLGLIHLKQAPAFVLGKAGVLAASLKGFDATGDYQAFAVAIIVTFPAFGFLFGYLSTRLYLASAFARADLAAINSAQITADATSGAVESLSESLAVLTAKINQSTSPLTAVATAPTTPAAPAAVPAPAGPPIVPVASIVAASAPAAAEKLADPQAELKERILTLARQYSDFESGNKTERIQFRSQLAEQLAVLINAKRFIRDWVVETARSRNDDALVAGLATAINAEPERDDVSRLLRTATIAQYKHSRYKVATAMGRLFDARLAGPADAMPALAILDAYFNGDTDDALKRRLRQTAAQISQSTGMNVPNAPA